MKGRGILRIGRLEAEAPEAPSGDNASMFPGELGVDRDRPRRRKVEIALEGEPERAADGRELEEAHIAEFRLPEPEVAKTEGQIDVGVELGQEPGGVAVGGEELDDGFEVDDLVLAVDGGAPKELMSP